jgi:hypothetical protein
MCWRPSFRARSTTSVGTAGGHEFVTGLLLASDNATSSWAMGLIPGPSMVPMNDANPHRGINRPTGEMIESKGLRIER